MIIDLHGVRHHEVENILSRNIESKIINSKSDQIVVVTGNSEEMKKRVREVLDMYDLKYTEFLNTEIVFNIGGNR